MFITNEICKTGHKTIFILFVSLFHKNIFLKLFIEKTYYILMQQLII